MLKMTYRDWNCRVFVGKYGSGETAIRLMDEETLEPIATATVSVKPYGGILNKNEIAVKDYSENIGMFEALAEAGIVEDNPVSIMSLGFTEIPICRLIDGVLDNAESL